MIDFNSLFKYKSLNKPLKYSNYSKLFLRLHCTTAVFPWVNAIYRLSNQLTFRSYACYAFRFMLLSLTAFQEKCLFLLLISFGATQFSSLESKHTATSHHCRRRCFFSYHSTRNFRNYFVAWENSLSLREREFVWSPGSGGATSKI